MLGNLTENLTHNLRAIFIGRFCLTENLRDIMSDDVRENRSRVTGLLCSVTLHDNTFNGRTCCATLYTGPAGSIEVIVVWSARRGLTSEFPFLWRGGSPFQKTGVR